MSDLLQSPSTSLEQAIAVRTARPEDLTYVDSLQAKLVLELGFLTRFAIDTYIRTKYVTIGLLNGEPACYLLGRGPSQSSPEGGHIVQAAVQYDARHRLLGTTLVSEYVSRMPPWCREIYLWCAQDIEANVFWECQGFSAIGWRLGKQSKGRVHIFWRRTLGENPAGCAIKLPATTDGGMLRKPRLVIPLEPGQTWRDVRPERRPDVIAHAWPRKPSKLRSKPKSPVVVVPTVPVLCHGVIIHRPLIGSEVRSKILVPNEKVVA